jgi:hypothetical protein
MNQAAEHDNDPETSGHRSSNRSLLILGIVGGILCVILVACGGVIYLSVRVLSGPVTAEWRSVTMGDEIQASETAAHRFMTAISRGRAGDAYAGATEGFQSRQTLQQFRDLVNGNPALKYYRGQIARDAVFEPDRNTYRGKLGDPNGMTTSFTVVVIKDGENWKVDRFTIP